MFFLYGAQGPTAFSNGPTCVEVQGDWIIQCMQKLREEKIDYCDATREAEEGWREKVTELSDKTLFVSKLSSNLIDILANNRKPLTKSWYMGDNVPGKFREQLNFAGGFPLYKELTQASLDRGFEGFVTA